MTNICSIHGEMSGKYCATCGIEKLQQLCAEEGSLEKFKKVGEAMSHHFRDLLQIEQSKSVTQKVYEGFKEMNKAQNNLMDWSRNIVNYIMTKNNNSKYIYQVEIAIRPNPLNFDGVDNVFIEIMEQDQETKNERFYFGTKNCFNIEEAIAQVEEFTYSK